MVKLMSDKKPFIDGSFLLQSKSARYLYQKYAADQPIIDYHGHLPPADIAADRRFNDLFEIWLAGDHYKWRAMRANGEAEKFCTGAAGPFEKFMAWARTVPHTLRNPLYHWTHLELQRYFSISDLLDPGTAPLIWKLANEKLRGDDLSVRGILKRFRVTALCTTDDPADDLSYHRAIAAAKTPGTKVFPTFRPDRALQVHLPAVFNPWLNALSAAADVSIERFADFLQALRKRHDDFHALGCRLSDHGLNHCYADFCTEREASVIFDKARAVGAKDGASLPVVSSEEQSKFASFMMLFFGHLDAEKDWTKQLHLGARRNANSAMLQHAGPDTGFDSIGDWRQADALGAYLDRLNQENALPKTIIYNLNPSDNHVIATMIGNFQDGSTAGKIQFGSGWWFMDQKEGIEWQLNALSSAGLLSRFVGMLTDSRSFMSFPRHEYFRRVLCNLIGREVEEGILPDREDLLGTLIENVCFKNAQSYLGLNV
jgi:glucuronate isomerase